MVLGDDGDSRPEACKRRFGSAFPYMQTQVPLGDLGFIVRYLGMIGLEAQPGVPRYSWACCTYPPGLTFPPLVMYGPPKFRQKDFMHHI
jgi:hypothetical protein